MLDRCPGEAVGGDGVIERSRRYEARGVSLSISFNIVDLVLATREGWQAVRDRTTESWERSERMAGREEASILDAVLTEPTDRQTLSGAVVDRLRELIISGQMPAGLPLRPTHLAPRLGVSVMPVREALRVLSAEGLVSITPRIGAQVADINKEDIEELYLVRGALEGFAARLAVRNLEGADLLAVQEAFDEMGAARARGDLEAFSRWDREFHRRQYAASDRPSLVEGILERWDASRRVYTIVPPSSMEPPFEAHRAILEAIRLRDGRAAEHLTRIHIEQALERILATLRELRA